MEVCSKTTCLGAAAGNYFYRLQFGGARGAADLQHELFPLHSPLLRESWLVSFPPLSYMFKFSGSSFLTWGLICVFCLFCFKRCFKVLKSWSDAWRVLGRVHHAARVSHWALTVLEVIFFLEEEKHPILPSPFIKEKREQMGGNRHSCRNASRSTRKRNLRSKIWWFTEFCNSHYVSHFAAFFIVARTKTSAAKSYFKVVICLVIYSCVCSHLKKKTSH